MTRTIVVTGANGWIGGKVARRLMAQGYRVIGVSRTPATARDRFGEIEWIGLGSELDQAVMETGAVVNCAGFHPFERPWDDAGKQLVSESRVGTTRRIAAALGHSQAPEKVLVNASGTWFYGECGEDTVSEDRPSTNATFLARMHVEWEDAALNAEHSGTRVVPVRIGLGIGNDGGALPFLRQPFDQGMGVILGTGRQWIPWIHIDDLTNLFVEAVTNPRYRGPINGSAPEPARYADLAQALGRALGKPCEVTVPVDQVHGMFGEASEILLTSCRAIPAKARDLGFQFRYTDLDEAMRATFG